MWLHFSIKEREGEPGRFDIHDDDWHPILHRDLQPAAIFFIQPKLRSTKYRSNLEQYGMYKLGGFGSAKVVGSVGSEFAICERIKPGDHTTKVQTLKNTLTYTELEHRKSREISDHTNELPKYTL